MNGSTARSTWFSLAGPVAGAALLVGVGVAALTDSTEPTVDSTETGLPDRVAPPVAIDLEVDVVMETVEVTLPPRNVEQQDDYLPEGLTRVVSSGEPGLALTTYSVSYYQGREVSRIKVSTIVVEDPIDDVVAVGSLEVPARPAVVPGSNRAIGQDMAIDHGWVGIEWTCLDNLWERESNWRHLVANPASGAYGIPQALPGDKMATAGSDWKTNPATQIAWGFEYIEDRYGTPCSAWGSWSNRDPHWY